MAISRAQTASTVRKAPSSRRRKSKIPKKYLAGLSAEDNGERLEKKRGLEILKQILEGNVKKIIFAGYATDPLNCSYIEDLLELTIKNKAVFGFNTKAIRVSERFLDIITFNKSSVGNSIPINRKLLILDLRSSNLKLTFLIEGIELISK